MSKLNKYANQYEEEVQNRKMIEHEQKYLVNEVKCLKMEKS